MKINSTIIFIVSIVFLGSCNEFVDISTPKTQIVRSKVFDNDGGARAAVSGIFSQMMAGGSFASGNNFSTTAICGLSSDEFQNHSTLSDNIALYNNSLTPLNSAVSSNWNDMYLYIYEANSIIEGCADSKQISKAVQDQVVGEAKFIRAFAHFYLVNLFGDVPLITSTDYRINSVASRAPTSEVYGQIEADLIDAQKLLRSDYALSNNEKVEPNKWAATALLARAYLYQKRWAEAEAQAAAIIDGQVFSLVSNLNSVFLKNSTEAIWQLMPSLPGFNTNEAGIMAITASPTRWSLTSSATSVFEPTDKRLASWVGSFTTGGRTFTFQFKYKVRLRDQPLTEYYMVFRLAEQYLIRAEARAMQSNLAGAVADLNVIRVRAGVPAINVAGMTQVNVMTAIEKERRAELIGEWGHRWFDLKRWGRADAVLGPIKSDWQSKDALFPIPQADINTNPNLVQNP